MGRTRKSQQKKNTLTKMQGLCACTVVLRNIALDADLIQRYQLNLPLKQEKLFEQSHINTPTHSKKQLLKGNVQKKNATRNRNCTIKSSSKKIVSEEKRKDNKKIELQQTYEVIKVNKDVLSDQGNEKIPKLILKRLIHHMNVEPVPKSTDETSSTSSVTHFNYMQKMAVLMNKNDKNVRQPSIKIEIDVEKIQHLNKPDVTNDTDVGATKLESNDTNCSDKKNLTVNDYNRNTQEISSKSILYTQCNNNNNLYSVNFSDGVRCKVKQERCKKNKNNKDIIVQTPICHAEVLKENNTKTTKIEIRQNLPKIIGNCILSKGIKVLKVAKKEIKIDELRVNNGLQSSIPEQTSLEQDRYNNNKNTNETFHINDTVDKEITTISRENHTSIEINGSTNILKSPLPLNNVDLKDDNISFHSKFINYKNLNSWTKERKNGHIDINGIYNETTMIHKNYTSNHQEQLNRFSNNIAIHENNELQDNKKCEERCTNNILNENQHTQEMSNLIDDENCSTLLISSKKGNIKQTQKRTLKEKDEVSNLNSKKIKLNRNNWQQSNKTFKSINHNQCSDFSSSAASITTDTTTDTTTELNISEEHNHKKRMDLREHLDQIKLEKTLNTTVETKNEEVYKKPFAKKQTSTLNKTLCEKKNNAKEEHKSVGSDNEDDDCISLYFNESLADFDITRGEDKFVAERDKSCHSLHFDVPYEMTANSFDKFVKQNNNEFDEEYAECIENNIKIKTEPLTFNKPNEEVCNNQSTQTSNTYCIPATATEPNSLQVRNTCPTNENFNGKGYFKSYCYSVLRNKRCIRHQCMYYHNLRSLFDKINLKDTGTIIDIIREALNQNFNYFCEEVYISLLRKLTVEQILKTYNMLYGTSSLFRREFINLARRNIACNIIEELLKRYIPIKVIFEYMVTYILPTENTSELWNIIICVQKYMKHDEYWDSVRNFILKSDSNTRKYIIDEMIHKCIMSKNLENIQDVNSNLINKLEPTTISILDIYKLTRFRNILGEKPAKSPKVSISNFGEHSTTDTIASPDRSPNANFAQQESSTRCDNFVSETDSNQSETQNIQAENVKPYIYGFLQPVDVPSVQCTYKNHELFWKFFVDLDRFEKGLRYEDYDYITSVLKNYNTKKRERELFVSKCSLILRKIERSDYHLRNILRRTVQTGTFNTLDKIIFDIGLDILTNLVDEEAWGLALQLMQSLNIYDLPYNAEYFLLSAEIYLANRKAVKACNLLKYKNIICTSREKWYVKNTVKDESVRNKIIYILLDSFCNEFLEHAFFLFQFLLKDQSSYYYPIDLSRYVDKLIILSLLKMDTNITTEMAQLVLKHGFALSTITCRALISTIIQTDEVLAKQIYNYAEGIGVYSAVKLLPVIHIIINTDLTEEEIYLLFLQLLKNLIMNYGHAIEFAKPKQIKVYYILEIKSTKQFYCAALQHHYNNQVLMKTKTLIRSALRKRFDPPILLMQNRKGRIGKIQSTSLINYLKSEHCN